MMTETMLAQFSLPPQMLSLGLLFSITLFAIGCFGCVYNRKNLLIVLMCLELLLLAVNINFILAAAWWRGLLGQMLVFFILAVAAVEASVGLALVVAWFRVKTAADQAVEI